MKLLEKKKVVLFDGGMGTELAGRGCEMGGVSNLYAPEAVVAVHRDYCLAGADVLITNTFTMNRINLESSGLDIDVREVNEAGVRLARRAAGRDKLVFGDLGPTGKMLKPYGDRDQEEIYSNYSEQALLLARGNVDGLIIETFSDLREAVCALKACRDKTTLPVIISLAFSTTEKGGRTIMGNTVEETVRAAEEHGAVAVGANCGDLDPQGMLLLVAMFKDHTDLPIIIQPNAGKPKLVEGQTVFDMQPDHYAEDLIKCVEMGASIVGGCCGTTPAHIAALARSLGQRA